MKHKNRPQRHEDTKIRLLLFLILAFACLAAFSQTPQQQPPKPPAGKADPQKKTEDSQKKDQEGFKIGVEVNLVTVPVTVRKPGGGFLKGLKQEDFEVFEEGTDQKIEYFAQEGVPTKIAIVLDISGSVRPEWGSIKLSTRKFAENLQQEDQFSLTLFNTETHLKMDWGRDTKRLDSILSSVYCKDETNLWDSIYVVADDLFKGVREKKAIIVMSDGLDNNSTVSYNEMLQAAVRSEAAVYVVSKTEAVRQSIMYAMAQAKIYESIPQELFLQADLALRKLAYETGGRVLYPNSFGQLDNIYADVDEELRNQYTIGYFSTNKVKDGSYRKIKVIVGRTDAQVSARPGYYAPNALTQTSPRR